MVVSPTGLGSENECPGEGQQQLQMTDPSSCHRKCYIRTMTAGVQLRKIYSGRESQGARRQDELTGGKTSVVK
jgi:ribosomal protein S19E (S16A)